MTTDTILGPLAGLTIPDSIALAGRAQQALTFIDGFVIDSAEMYELAGEELQSVKRRAQALEAQRTSITGPINAALKAVNDLFRQPAALLAKAEELLKQRMLEWVNEQERIAREARRAAEAKAAAERAELEAQAAARQAEAQAQAQAAEAARKAGDEQAAALATANAQRASAEAQTAATTAQMVTAAPLVAAPPSAAGISTRKKLDFEVVDLLALVQHIAANPALIGLVAPDEVRLRAYVKGLGAACQLPGVNVTEGRVLSARTAA